MLNSRLTIKHLKMMHAIEVAETLTKAAELLNISQPALTSRLHDAESILGIRLFQRRGRKLMLSTPGQLLLRSARRILKELADVEYELTNLPGGVGEVLRIGVPQYASFSWLPKAVKAFEAVFPSVELEIASDDATKPRRALARGDLDVALVASSTRRIQIDRRRLRSRHLIRDEFVALLPKNHRLAKRLFLVADDFINETYITDSAVPERNREYELFFQPNTVYPDRVVQVGLTGAILELVAAGIGITIATRWTLASDDRLNDVVSKPLNKSGVFMNWHAVYADSDSVEPQVNELCQIIAKSADRVS